MRKQLAERTPIAARAACCKVQEGETSLPYHFEHTDVIPEVSRDVKTVAEARVLGREITWSLDANGNLQVQSIAQSQQPSNVVNLKGQMNHLIIIAQGSKLTWIINGTTVATITDNSYKSGTMALFVSNVANVQPGAIATFQNLAVFPAQ